MTIKKSEYSNMCQAYEQAVYQLKSLSDIKNLPDVLKQKILVLKKEFEAYDMTQHQQKLKTLNGNVLSLDEAKEIVVDASGYTKWSAYENNGAVDSEGYPEFFQKYHGVDVSRENIKVYHFERRTHSRDEFHFIEVIVLPGHVFVSLHTGRVGYDSEGLLDKNSLHDYLSNQFELQS